MITFPAPIEVLIEKFAALPGIGKKSAQRHAFSVLSLSEEEANSFAYAIINAKESIHRCKTCFNYTDSEECSICTSTKRDRTVICVVSEPKDLISIERAGEYNGLYHVLHGVISPVNGVGPDDIKLKELLQRIEKDKINEVIMAMNPDTEGEATAMYIAGLLKPFEINVSRLAYGIPMGSNLEFTDNATLSRALEGRISL
jgi:recombination protein RecR